jgi:hypothetical protein
MRNEAREGASMNSKRRLRAVFLSALLMFACLTAIPAPSSAYVVKWWFPELGDPDVPGNTSPLKIYAFGLLLYYQPTVGIVLVPYRLPTLSQRASHNIR